MNVQTKWQAELDGGPHESRLDSESNGRGSLTIDELLQPADREFVANAYRRILGREPDQAGLDNFLSQLRSGALEKIEVLGTLRFSAEGRAVGTRVDGLPSRYFLSVLRHAPRYAARLTAMVRGPKPQVQPRDGRIAELEARLAIIENGWREHMPAFLNAVSTVRAFGFELLQSEKKLRQEFDDRLEKLRQELDERLATEEAASRQESEAARGEIRAAADAAQTGLAKTQERIEFVRREMMFEHRYGRTNGNGDNGAARICSPEKLAAANGHGVKLNLGCGHIALADYVNVDRRDLPGVDIVAPVDELPLGEASVSEIFSAHMLEHFPQEELRRRLLPYWFGLLTSGGSFRAVVPDGEAMLTELASSNYPFEDFREVLFGSQEYHGDFHYNLFTPDSLRRLLEEAGFRGIEVPARGRRNGKCYEFEIRALKP
jgi:predicted SAM-dependent methyltransferase